MNFITPQWPAPEHVRAVSTTRDGGVSDGAYASLNLGSKVGDKIADVKRNRTSLCKHMALPGEPVWLDQVHGVKVIDAAKYTGDVVAADGSFSTSSNVVCAIMTADCVPLLLTNKQGSQVAAVHAGWRGLANGVIEQGVASFSCAPQDIIAWAGPCIGPEKFEIGAEVRNQLGGPEDAYIEQANGKLLANLYRLAAHRLAQIGVSAFTHSAACTYTDAARFFSYRRDGPCGRMATLIWLEQV